MVRRRQRTRGNDKDFTIMAHYEQQQYCISVKQKYPKMFNGVKVLDVGSMDINGNNRYLFDNSDYIGIDIGCGENVDLVCSGSAYRSAEEFDVIISTECFEHDKFWALTIFNTYMHLKSGGLYLFTCASDGRPEHGTARTTSGDSPCTNDYYMNLNVELVVKQIPIRKMFSKFEFSTRSNPCDLYFYGIKK
jgi:hypothetical protein